MSLIEGDILRVVASLLFPDDVIMQNVFHIVLTTINGTGSESEVGDDMVAYIEDIYAEIEGNISDEIDADELKIYVYDPIDDDFDEVISEPFTDSYAGSPDFLPHGVAGLILIRTLDPDVSGKKYFGGFGEGSQLSGEWGAGTIVNLGAAGIALASQYTDPTSGNVYTPGVWSVKETNFFPANNTIVVNATPAYQRRRKPGVGI